MEPITASVVALTQALSMRPKGSRNTKPTRGTPKRRDLEVVTERMLAIDPRDVGDDVLLAVLLVGTTKRRSPLDEARRLIGDVDGDLSQLVDEPREDLGLSRPGQARFVAAAELLRRAALRREARPDRPKIISSASVVKLLRATVGGASAVESFAILTLDVRDQVISLRTLTRGTFDHTIVDVRQIARHAVSVAAKSIIMVHNHPSGDVLPSADDIRITQKVQEALKPLGITVLDHIVVSSSRYSSLLERGEMKLERRPFE